MRFPRGFHAWIVASLGSELGSGMLAFALTWTASGYGPGIAATVAIASVLPPVLLGLVGGAVADRIGPRRVLIAAELAMILICSWLAVTSALWGAVPWVLVAVATFTGTVSAFARPAAGTFPRLFVEEDRLGSAVARAGMAQQVVRTTAPPLGGLLVGPLSLAGVALLDLVGFLALMITLVLVRPPRERRRAGDRETGEAGLRSIAVGLRAARSTEGVPNLLLAMSIMAGGVLPAVLLGIPLAARERGWSATETGWVEACWVVGGLATSAWFAWRGTATRPHRPMAIGPLVVAVGLVALAVAPTWPLAAAGTTVVGVGVVVFTAHVFPTYLTLTPPAMTSRFQSLLILVQQFPMLPANAIVGVLAASAGTGVTIGLAAVLAAATPLVVLRDRTLRTRRTPTDPQDMARTRNRGD
jgi:MFS family permease